MIPRYNNLLRMRQPSQEVIEMNDLIRLPNIAKISSMQKNIPLGDFKRVSKIVSIGKTYKPNVARWLGDLTLVD